MNRNEFAYTIPAADTCFRGFALVLQILRGKTDGNKRKDVCTLTNGGAAIDDTMRFKSHTVA